MKKIRLATVWLDGCAGCHMSLLDIDEAILAVAKKMDMVYGPLVDAQEFPKAVDVTLIEGAVSSQDDLEKMRTDPPAQQAGGGAGRLRRHRQRARPCATRMPARKMLERIYIEGAQENKGRSHRRRSRAAAAGRAGARSGEGGSARPGLPAARQVHRVRVGRTAGGPHAGSDREGEIRLKRNGCKRCRSARAGRAPVKASP